MNRKPPQINGVTLRVLCSRLNPDFWVPSKAPEKTEKARGNLIDVPTNNTRTTSGTHVIPGQQAPNKPKNQSGAAKSNPYTISSKYKRDIGSAEEQRAFKTLSPISVEELSFQPGEIKGASCNPHLFETSMKTWCETAFICYETLHNLSSDSNQGTVHTSTLTWGSQLDISTFRMHYGSSFTPSGSERQYPVLSSLTVEMRQYGDKDSAAGVLAIRNNGQLPDSCDSSLTEGINVTTRAPILSMKCLESGHLVASSGSRNTDYTLQVWDMRDQREKAEVPVAIYDSTVLVGSGEHAQIARWDPRSPKDAFTSLACRRTEASSYHRRQFDPIYDISWNPSNSNEFITVHANAIRVWDARKMDHDGCSTLHIFEGRRLRRARWSPHHSDCIASLSLDGQVKIWKINKFDNQTDIITGAQTPELLFVHQAHE
ncbi:hypothetical protein BGZ79_010461 [Entomortierella chlamydospora]|nr:hypothetical protein BGZ79_010461 [Entomortierella chlamydospora]